MHIIQGANSPTFTLTAETTSDRDFLDAINDRGAHCITTLEVQRTQSEGGFVNSGVSLLIDRNHPHVLERESGRQLLRTVRELFRLGFAEDALNGHISLHAANPDAQDKLTSHLQQLQLVLQALTVSVIHATCVGQEVHCTHSSSSSGCETAILDDRQGDAT